MRTDLKTLPASGLSVKEIGESIILSFPLLTAHKRAESIVASTDVKGFPIISADGRNILLGFIDRTDLRYVFGSQTACLHMV